MLGYASLVAIERLEDFQKLERNIRKRERSGKKTRCLAGFRDKP